jgi:hypothetical protein
LGGEGTAEEEENEQLVRRNFSGKGIVKEKEQLGGNATTMEEGIAENLKSTKRTNLMLRTGAGNIRKRKK